VKAIAVLLITLPLFGCGGGDAAHHYDVTSALDCVQRTDSVLFKRFPKGILVAFSAPDGISAIEPVAVAFKPESAEVIARSPAPTRLGVTKPTWVLKRGDAEVWGLGPYEPPIARRRGISDDAAKAAAAALGARVRPAIDDCLKQNDR
jgi:hypothetical protein